MDDVFFLAQPVVTLAQLAEAINDDTSFVASHVDNGVTVLSGEGRLMMSVLQMKAEELSDEDRKLLRSRRIRCCFCLSHRTPEVADVLLPISRALLARFGGWIGADADEFEPLIGMNDLELLLRAQP